MTLTINPEIYANLLTEYQPKVIKTDEENDHAIAIAEKLAHRQNKTGEESTLLELLIALIEKYEDAQYPMGETNSHLMLLHLMEARGLKQSDLVGILGSSGVTSEVVNGKRGISKAQAKALGKFFNIDPGLFI
ncbi:helix-turn-helix domain-containing protein [Brunnivagina elsteri]|uniref:Transcriptional regulator n=1 Tax=Brunnivagina elsteri CCALA 953 TaxID=987040 RepID=A0A2A2TGZ7_9CYAN|nr:transcriptional regulator [Calothrix elsteri]PAX53002.1 transcriptional regulator [Calothrix elsteri CCALA 953]